MKGLVEGVVASIIVALMFLIGTTLLVVMVSAALLVLGAGIATLLNVIAALLQSVLEVTAVVVLLGFGASKVRQFPEWVRGRLPKIEEYRLRLVRISGFDEAGSLWCLLPATAVRLLPITAVVTVMHLWGGGHRWNAMGRLSEQLEPPGAAVGRDQRFAVLAPLRTITDVPGYEAARSAEIESVAERAYLAMDKSGYVTSRCGAVPVPTRPEVHKLASLLVDLSYAPPLQQEEYTFNENELTGWFVATVPTDGSVSPTVDCVKLSRDYVTLFASARKPRGGSVAWAYGMSVVKKDHEPLRVTLDEISRNWISVQLGWLGGGAVGGGWWGFMNRATASGRETAAALATADSRTYSVEVREGYLRIVTWRLPTVVACRAAHAVGYVAEPFDYRVAPDSGAESLAPASEGEIVYTVLENASWLYVCSEATSRFGWLPKSVVRDLHADYSRDSAER